MGEKSQRRVHLDVPPPIRKSSVPSLEGFGRAPTLRRIATRAERTIRQVQGQEDIEEPGDGYVLRQFWYFCEDTSLHGWRYITRFPVSGCIGWLHRICWFLLVVVSVFFAFWNVTKIFCEYLDQKPVISIDDTTGPLDEVYFPSVTVCNMNQFRMSQANRMGLDPKKYPDVFRTFLTKYLDTRPGADLGLDEKQRNTSRFKSDNAKLGQNNITWADELENIKGNLSEAGIDWDETAEPFIKVNGTAQDCSDLLLHTKWNGKDKYSYNSHISYTDFGYCCRIFPTVELSEPKLVNNEYNKSGDWVLPAYKDQFWDEYKLRRGSKNGIENGLMLLMDVESFENAQYPSKAEGLIVALSGDLERPLVGQSGTFVEAGSANLISVQVFGTNTTEDAVDAFSPDTEGTSATGTRTCYADKDNFQPKYFNQDNYYQYSMSNCLYSAMVTSIEKQCNCTPVFNSGLTTMEGAWCLEGELTCVENRTKHWGSKKEGHAMAEDRLGGPPKQCHDHCDTQELRVVTSRSRYPKKRTLHLTEDFCLIVSKMRKICTDEGRKKAFEDYSADLYNQHPWHNKCSVVLGMFVCVVSLFICCWLMFRCGSISSTFPSQSVGWSVGQLLSDVYPVGVFGQLQSVHRPRDPRDYIGEELIGPKLFKPEAYPAYASL